MSTTTPKSPAPGETPATPATPASAANGSGGITHMTTAHLIAAVNARHAITFVNGKLLVMWPGEIEGGLPRLSSITDVKNYWKKGQRSKAGAIDVWLRSLQRREYDRMVFRPGITDTGRDFNLWRGWGVTPDPYGECRLFLHHISDVLCDGDADLFDYVEQWLASAVQTPEDKPGTALSFRGGQGSGKGAFVRYIGPIFGPHLARLAGSEQLLGRFNDLFAAKLMVFADEAAWPGNKAGIEKLKSYITEDKITVERKYVSAFEIDNYARFVFATNRDHAAPAEMDDRRFVPLNVSGAHIADQRYWNRLEAEREAGGPAALLHHLQNIPLTRNLRLTPKTGALAEQKLLSLDDVGGFVRELLMMPKHQLRSGYERESPAVRPHLNFGEVTTPQTLHAFYQAYCRRTAFHYPRSLDAFAKALHKYITVAKREARRDEIKSLDLQGIRPQVYTMPTVATGRAQFEKAHGQRLPWPDDGHDEVHESADVDQFPTLPIGDQFD
jgi:hypothetical protein